MPRQSPSQAEPAAQSQTEAAYSRWAPVYDLIFDTVRLDPGRSAAASAANTAAGPNGDMLVVGVGTGLELKPPQQNRAHHRHRSQRADAQGRARARRALGLRPCECPCCRWTHPRSTLRLASFDVALAPFVMSVVPDPQRVLDEMWRVLKPGGEIV